MIDYEDSKIRNYEVFIRDIVNSIVQRIDLEKVSYRIDRNSLNNIGDLSVRDEHNNSTIYNIYDSIIEFRVQAEPLLEKICVKVIENSFRSVINKKKDLNEKLRAIRDGV